MAPPNVFPDLALPATHGRPVNLGTLRGVSVVFVYPYTGRPGTPDPQGWDEISGAHGSTPQALGYKALHEGFRSHGVRVFGLSFQHTDWQKEFAKRNQLPFALLSDARAEMALRLGLEVFMAGLAAFLRRRTFVLRNGHIIYDNRQVAKPAADAALVLSWIKAL